MRSGFWLGIFVTLAFAAIAAYTLTLFQKMQREEKIKYVSCAYVETLISHVYLANPNTSPTLLLPTRIVTTHTHKHIQRGRITYVELAGIIAGTWAKIGVLASITAMTLGVCSAYLVFIGESLASGWIN